MVGGIATRSYSTRGSSWSSADAAGISSAMLASVLGLFTVEEASGKTWRETDWRSSPSGTLDRVTCGLGPLRSLRNTDDAYGDGVGWASRSSLSNPGVVAWVGEVTGVSSSRGDS